MSAGGRASDFVRIAVDIGGTFTDIVLERGSNRFTTKILTTPGAPDEAVIAGVAEILQQAAVAPSGVGLVIHGTTLATNAIIERRGARTAFVTTAGFRDVVEIGYESRYDQYDIHIEKPTPLVPRNRRFGVRERVGVDGRVIEALVESDVDALVPKLEAQGVESIAVGFLHAYANPDHERRAGERLSERLPGVSLTLSSEVCPEVREYERFTTATANAYVRPLMARYLERLEAGLRGLDLSCPILLMTSGGGLASVETGKRFPIRLVESGPAGGVVLAQRLARELGLDKVISFDMGGTTAKICLIEDGAPHSARDFEVDRAARFVKGSGLALRIPVIEMIEIGAGGGSIARIDNLGRIAVGPRSAGADPGPAAYDLGGEHPTVTDADVVLGRIEPDLFAGGRIPLDPARAESAIGRTIGNPLEVTAPVGALGVSEIVDETMANAARVHAVERGRVAAEHALVAFGGAAPLHVGRIAEKLAIDHIVVPTDAGVGSAVGFLRAAVAYEVVRSRPMVLGAIDPGTVNPLFAEMREEARAVVEAGAPGESLVETRAAYMRYRGQGHEIRVELPVRELVAEDEAILRGAFDLEYQRLYARVLPDAEIEVLTWILSMSNVPVAPEPGPGTKRRPAPPPEREREVLDPHTGESSPVPLYARASLDVGATLKGPALVAEFVTSTYVPRGFTATVAVGGHLLLDRQAGR